MKKKLSSIQEIIKELEKDIRNFKDVADHLKKQYGTIPELFLKNIKKDNQ